MRLTLLDVSLPTCALGIPPMPALFLTELPEARLGFNRDTPALGNNWESSMSQAGALGFALQQGLTAASHRAQLCSSECTWHIPAQRGTRHRIVTFKVQARELSHMNCHLQGTSHRIVTFKVQKPPRQGSRAAPLTTECRCNPNFGAGHSPSVTARCE